MSEPNKKGAFLGLVNREGFVCDLKFGGCLRDSDHELIEFLTLRKIKGDGGEEQNCLLGLLEGRFLLVKEIGWQSALEGSPERQRSPQRLNTLQKGNPKGTGSVHSIC